MRARRRRVQLARGEESPRTESPNLCDLVPFSHRMPAHVASLWPEGGGGDRSVYMGRGHLAEPREGARYRSLYSLAIWPGRNGIGGKWCGWPERNRPRGGEGTSRLSNGLQPVLDGVLCHCNSCRGCPSAARAQHPFSLTPHLNRSNHSTMCSERAEKSAMEAPATTTSRTSSTSRVFWNDAGTPMASGACSRRQREW